MQNSSLLQLYSKKVLEILLKRNSLKAGDSFIAGNTQIPVVTQCQVWQSSCLSPVVFLGFSSHYFVPGEPYERCPWLQQFKRPLARQTGCVERSQPTLWASSGPASRPLPAALYGSSTAQEGEQAAQAVQPQHPAESPRKAGSSAPTDPLEPPGSKVKQVFVPE